MVAGSAPATGLRRGREVEASASQASRLIGSKPTGRSRTSPKTSAIWWKSSTSGPGR